jgi:hypothetical protein
MRDKRDAEEAKLIHFTPFARVSLFAPAMT